MTDKITVLIADDTLIDREGLSRILESFGEIKVIGMASTPQEVIDIATRLIPDVVILDLKWFGNDLAGLYLIKELRKVSPKASILAVSAYEKLLKDAVKEGVDATMTKTFTTEEFVDRIRSLANLEK